MLEEAERRLRPLTPDLPAPLRASLERHRTHLADLVGSMQAAGLEEARIADCVRGLIDAYEVDLRQALREMGSAA